MHHDLEFLTHQSHVFLIHQNTSKPKTFEAFFLWFFLLRISRQPYRSTQKNKKKKFYSPFKSQSCRTMTDDAARANKRAASILANIPMPKSKRFNLELAPSETKIVIQQPQPSRRSQHLQIVPVANRANTRSQRVLAPPVPSEKDRFALVPKINAGGHEGLAKIAQECAEMCVRPSSAKTYESCVRSKTSKLEELLRTQVGLPISDSVTLTQLLASLDGSP